MTHVSRAKLIRLYADGELPADEREQFEEDLRTRPGERAAVDFEGCLRERVTAVISAGAPAPPDLADRVRRRLSETSEAAAPAVTGSVRRLTFPAWLRRPDQANIFAVAASLAVVAGAVLFGIFGKPIDAWRRPGPLSLAANAVPFVAGEHLRCAGSSDQRSSKATFPAPDQAALELSLWLGPRLEVESLVGQLEPLGWSFYGGGYCGVPGVERSAHLIFTRIGPQKASGPALLSIFVVPDEGRFALEHRGRPIEPLRWHTVTTADDGEVWVFSDRELLYLMVGCVRSDLAPASRAVTEAVAAFRR